jgi:hypothetical protein
MRFAASILALLLSVSAAFAAPIRFGDEVPLSATRYGEPTSSKAASGLATNGDGFLAAWGDSRGGAFVARIAADGTVHDPAGILLQPAGEAPVVAWTGRSYVVAWQRSARVYASSITPDGVFTAPRLVGTGPEGGDVRIASTGSTVLVTFRTHKGTSAYLLDLDLNLIAERAVVPQRNLDIERLELAALRDRYLLAAVVEGLSVTTFTLDANGVLSAPSPVPDSNSAWRVTVAASEDDFLVAWDMGSRMIRGRVITPANEPAGSLKLLDQVVSRTEDVRRQIDGPVLVWRDGEYLLAYRDGNLDVRLLRISADGDPLEAVTEPVARVRDYNSQVLLTTRSDGSGALFYVVMPDSQTEAVRPLLRLFDSAAVPALGKPIPLQRTAREQLAPVEARVGATSVVAWLERTLGSNEIRVSMHGHELVVAQLLAAPLWLDVVDDGGTIWVLWVTANSEKLHLRRFTRTLEPIDENPRQLSMPEKLSRVQGAEGGGGAVLIVTETDDARELVATVLRSEGLLPSVIGELALPLQPHPDYGATVAFDGTNFLVVWQHALETAPWIPEDRDLQLARITPEAELLDLTPHTLASIRGDYRGFGPARVVSGHGSTVVAWQRPAGTYAAFLNGTTLGEVREIHSLEVEEHILLQIVPLPNGSFDFYYSDRDVSALEVVQYRHDRVSAALTTDSEPRVIVEVRREMYQSGYFTPTADDLTPRVIYSRTALEPEYGTVERLFVRTGFAGTSRRRAVR